MSQEAEAKQRKARLANFIGWELGHTATADSLKTIRTAISWVEPSRVDEEQIRAIDDYCGIQFRPDQIRAAEKDEVRPDRIELGAFATGKGPALLLTAMRDGSLNRQDAIGIIDDFSQLFEVLSGNPMKS